MRFTRNNLAAPARTPRVALLVAVLGAVAAISLAVPSPAAAAGPFELLEDSTAGLGLSSGGGYELVGSSGAWTAIDTASAGGYGPHRRHNAAATAVGGIIVRPVHRDGSGVDTVNDWPWPDGDGSVADDGCAMGVAQERRGPSRLSLSLEVAMGGGTPGDRGWVYQGRQRA